MSVLRRVHKRPCRHSSLPRSPVLPSASDTTSSPHGRYWNKKMSRWEDRKAPAPEGEFGKPRAAIATAGKLLYPLGAIPDEAAKSFTTTSSLAFEPLAGAWGWHCTQGLLFVQA